VEIIEEDADDHGPPLSAHLSNVIRRQMQSSSSSSDPNRRNYVGDLLERQRLLSSKPTEKPQTDDVLENG